MSKSYVHVAPTLRDAWYEYLEYIRTHMYEVGEYYKQSGFYCAILKNGNCHYFMNYSMYAKWCKGRTYYTINDAEYHSGYEVKR